VKALYDMTDEVVEMEDVEGMMKTHVSVIGGFNNDK
jgi:hypothetical protein